MNNTNDPEDFIGACDPSLLSDSLPGQPKPRATMMLPKRMDWDNGEMVPHSSGEYCDHENVCEILGERDAYIAILEARIAELEAELAEAKALRDELTDEAHAAELAALQAAIKEATDE